MRKNSKSDYSELKGYQFQHKKKWGQNFLSDENIVRRIVEIADLPNNALVVEIGVGLGILTKALLNYSNSYVIALEKDTTLKPYLQQFTSELPENKKSHLAILFQDALLWSKTNIVGLVQEAKLANPKFAVELNPNKTFSKLLHPPIDVVANLPYQIATELLVQFCYAHQHYRQLLLMLQKEVALRLVAKPKTSAYGRLSILVQTVAQAEIVLSVKNTSFYPVPKVDSAVVLIKFYPDIVTNKPPCDLEKLAIVTNIAFQQRRKQLHNSLKPLYQRGLTPELLANLTIASTARAEELPIEIFWQLANNLTD